MEVNQISSYYLTNFCRCLQRAATIPHQMFQLKLRYDTLKINYAMKNLGERALLYVANLAVPSFQVVVLKKVKLGCSFCRWKVFQVISRIRGLKEFTVDVSNEQVIAVGASKLYQKATLNVKHTKWRIRKISFVW
ncbi:OLC1v1031853C1 [Oldenlandia corymbosa var. corymbosa]|uniref:OLC1v1031853C1 n=1 Tax=Oldenlandia corymbosa var. corymbosa TaxID=529605 RepID=A0AAV1CJI9_OLDCO|nr:OLC1v1031853C1 [Oldenlandia corymbosa var. corymbosa]